MPAVRRRWKWGDELTAPPAEIERAFALELLATLNRFYGGGHGCEKVGERSQARVPG